MTHPSSSAARRPADHLVGAVALATLLAATAAGVANTVIAVLARAAGASEDFAPLWPSAYLPLTVLGVVAGAAGWQVVRQRADDPAAVLRRLVPAVIALSLIPDLVVGVLGSSPGVSWAAVTALMLMHLAVAAVAVPVYRRLMPLR